MGNAKEKYDDFRIGRICDGLKKRNMNPYYCKSVDEMIETVFKLVEGEETVGYGGSKTLEESGIIDLLDAKDGITLYDRRKAKDKEETFEIFRKSLCADVFFMSTNAITEDGILVNIDGTGNRCAALVFGPKKVVIVAGVNKVCSTLDEAVMRARTVAAPMNAIRLERNTPCTYDGMCHDCNSPESICSHIIVTRRCNDPDRIHVVLVDKDYGF